MSRGIPLVFSLLYGLLFTISSGLNSQEALEITSESDFLKLKDLRGNLGPSVPKRREKLFSIFSVVRFSNDMCGSGTYNGTCLTAAECFAAGGSSNNTCAAGFGVCCVFLYRTCGGSTNRNCTYFQSPDYPSSSVSSSLQCSFTVNKCSADICQVRLDFLAFGLAQPETQSATNYPLATQCTTDSFTVTGASNNVPAICGLNTGQHVYLDMTAGQNSFSLNFAIGSGTGPPGQTVVTANQRYWNVKISQIPCDSPSLAPPGCLQYFSSASGTIRTFNYDLTTPTNSRHLANQDYPICIRMEQGFCGICYSTCDDSQFAFGLSNGYSTTWTTNTNAAIPYFCLNDYVQIAGAFLPAVGTFPAEFSDRICGGAFGIRTGTNAVTSPMTVCTETKPFQVRVVTDSNEVVSSGTIPLESGVYGFCLNYAQQACVTSG